MNNERYDMLNDSWRKLTKILRVKIVENDKKIDALEKEVERLTKILNKPHHGDDDYLSCSDACTDLY